MKKEDFYIALIFIIQALFELIPNWPEQPKAYDLFLLSDQELTLQTWAHYLLHHVVLILFSYLCIVFSGGYWGAKVLLILQVFYMLDFIVWYNENWIGVIEIHLVSLVIFGLAWFRYGWSDRNGGTNIADGWHDLPSQETTRRQTRENTPER